MGMAASQARFLSLTARKSNTEYEGQQINQERTALANESSNIFSQLSNMEVPTPPNTSDFYKTVYNFNSKDINGQMTKFSMEGINSNPDGDAAVLIWKENRMQYMNSGLISAGGTNISTGEIYNEENKEALKDKYKSHAEKLTGLSFTSNDSETRQIFKTDFSQYEASIKTIVTPDETGSYNKEFADYYGYDAKTGKFSEDAKDKPVYYYLDDNNKICFCSPEKVDAAMKAKGEDTTGVSGKVYGNLSDGIIVTKVETKQKDEFPVVSYETNDLGRITSIKIVAGYEKDADGKEDKTKPIIREYSVDCTREQDEEAYEQAMMDYEYQYAKYQKETADLNAKTEDIQAKDKTLELELKQLDTEQNAIKTEMDAVQKVIEDNTESTFKTFG